MTNFLQIFHSLIDLCYKVIFNKINCRNPYEKSNTEFSPNYFGIDTYIRNATELPRNSPGMLRNDPGMPTEWPPECLRNDPGTTPEFFHTLKIFGKNSGVIP